MVRIGSIDSLHHWGSRPGTGPFGFLFTDGRLGDVLGSLLYWHSAALVAVVTVAFVAGYFENRGKTA